ncbi:SMP-30/Gluconolaconase/LRE-like region [Aspergillus luchuensis]|uniref:SMP-30/Gluconolaconase/LRE-like region n=1 Tax=Aspergillus kawachii TaxID=1069201 RepID=A0A146FHL5_ASPKA|nr:SMP-30/Gluconolaconase/LRE-like region [Aspergillus luchuensis]
MTNSEITGFQSHHKDFDAITGPTPTLELLAEHRDYPFAHEAGIYIPETNNLWITSNRCVDPNGSKSEQKVYITRVDLNTNPITYEEIPTEIPMGNGGINYGRDHILICVRGLCSYAFDVSTIHGQPFLTNRRLFAMADHGIPDGIKCDLNGNVYSGCGDGIHVWSPGGVLLGRILIDGGVANFCFGRNGEIFALNEHRLWRVQLGVGVKGALLGL